MTTTTLAPPSVDRPGPRTGGPEPGHRHLIGRPPAPARWERPAVIALLAATAVAYLWGLGASGWANSFYSAAVQAGATSWKAFFFGSSDAANFITIDKPPAALWVMELSARLFGVNALEHPGAPGPGGRGRRRAALRHGAALVRRRRRRCWRAPCWRSRRSRR